VLQHTTAPQQHKEKEKGRRRGKKELRLAGERKSITTHKLRNTVQKQHTDSINTNFPKQKQFKRRT
jgi:hypothetical protein